LVHRADRDHQLRSRRGRVCVKFPEAEAGNPFGAGPCVRPVLFGRSGPGGRGPAPRPVRPGDWWPVLRARGPERVFDHSVRGIRRCTKSPKRLPRSARPRPAELGARPRAWASSSAVAFVFSQHCKSCRTAGIDEEKIAAIPHWSVADCFLADRAGGGVLGPITECVWSYELGRVFPTGRVRGVAGRSSPTKKSSRLNLHHLAVPDCTV